MITKVDFMENSAILENLRGRKGGHKMSNGSNHTNKILDDLTTMNISRQRKYQIRHMRSGLCIECTREAHAGTLYCDVHNKKRGIKEAGKNGQRLRIWVDILSPTPV
jgi:hypothetical protein